MVIYTYKCAKCKSGNATSRYDLEYRFCDRCRRKLIENETLPSVEELERRISALTSEIETLKKEITRLNDEYLYIDQQNKSWLWHLMNYLGVDIRSSKTKNKLLILKSTIYEFEKKAEFSNDELYFYLALKKRNIISASIRYKHRIEVKKQLRQNKIDKRQIDFKQITETVGYSRNEFLIRKMDYKRGNLLDNYVRNVLSEYIFDVFQNKCISCERQDELTLDHFWLPKNEGGNFIMLHTETLILVNNTIVLCRSCNSSKGDREYKDFFTLKQIECIIRYHKKLSEFFQTDKSICAIASKWYKKRIDILNIKSGY
ncbi:MAG: hypothetical protein ACOX27_03050 [Caldicoprobacterales bacterium]